MHPLQRQHNQSIIGQAIYGSVYRIGLVMASHMFFIELLSISRTFQYNIMIIHIILWKESISYKCIVAYWMLFCIEIPSAVATA